MAFLGSFGKIAGKGLKLASKGAGFIPGVGTLAAAGMGGLGELLEKGNRTNLKGFLGSTAGGALGGLSGRLIRGAGGISGLAGKLGLGGEGGLGGLLGTGSKLKDMLKLGGMALGGKQMYDASKQSKADSAMARQLAQQSMRAYQDAMQGAQDRYNQNSPLRDMFRQGVQNFADPNNPFARQMPQQRQIQPNLWATMGHPPVPLGFNPMGQQRQNPLTGMLGGAGRTASVKGPNVSMMQDEGRDRAQEKMWRMR